MVSGLLGRSVCRPVMRKGIYSVYIEADVQALRDERNMLGMRVRELAHEVTQCEKKLCD